MTTAHDLIETTRQHLGEFPRKNKLADPAIADASTLVLEYDIDQVKEHSYVQVGLEVFYVWERNTGTKTLTVEPAQKGSVTSTHDQGDIVLINPAFPDHTILAALNADLQDLASPMNGLYRVDTVDLTYDASAGGYDLDGVTDMDGIIDILAEPHSPSQNWLPVTNYVDRRGVPTAQFPSGFALFLQEPGFQGRTLRVRYRRSFTPFTSLSQDAVTWAGLPESMHDLPPMGAAIRLKAPTEMARNSTRSTGDAQQLDAVPAGAISNSVRGLATLRQSRIAAEASKLAADNPIRSFIPTPVY